ncbi:MAG TPA: alpha/beta hydrolase domain-containing protein [Pyrinomonadaceae bacterium]|nr:alpha/beta hydrolase domain-containing protein [Pyrinomonadaceae bacterium]
MSNIESPLSQTTAGTFNRISYVQYKGRFTGETSQGKFSVPYEITAPSTPDKGNLRLLVEVPHFSDGIIARVDILGAEFLFGRGFSHAAAGYSAIGNRILDPNPGFEIVIAGAVVNPQQPQTDREIITQFASALRGNPHNLVGDVKKVYSIGFSDSGGALHRILNEPHGRDAFELSFPCIASLGAVHKPAPVSGKVVVYNTEYDFRPLEGESPNQRWYAGAGCPHISDSENSRKIFPGPPQSPLPPVKGTTPINWSPFMKALFMAGDAWVTEGKEPPPTTLLKFSAGQIERDALGNALGGIRHPALEVGEAKFISPALLPIPVPPQVWRLFGGYDHVRSIGDAGFFKNVGQYVKAFDAAAKALNRAGFLLDADEKDLTRKAKMNPSTTYTQNYKAELF